MVAGFFVWLFGLGLQTATGCPFPDLVALYEEAETAMGELEKLRLRFRRESRNVELIESILNQQVSEVFEASSDYLDAWTSSRLAHFGCVPNQVPSERERTVAVLANLFRKHLGGYDGSALPSLDIGIPFPIDTFIATYLFPILSNIRQHLSLPNPMLDVLLPETEAEAVGLTGELVEFIATYKFPFPSIGELLSSFRGSSRLQVEFRGDAVYDHFDWGEDRDAGYEFRTNMLPPFNSSIGYRGVAVSEEHSDWMDIHQVPYFLSRTHAMDSSISLYKSINHFEPDLLRITPYAGNCHLAVRLVSSSTVRPRLLILPYDPLKGLQVGHNRTDHFGWWRKVEHLVVPDSGDEDILERGKFVREGNGGSIEFAATALSAERLPLHASSLIDGQCGLEEAVQTLREQDYVLVSAVSADVAIFAQKRLQVAPEIAASKVLDFFWVRNRVRPYFKLYELTHPELSLAGIDSMSESPYFAEKPLAEFVLRQGKRGRCAAGLCECYPPFVGDLCAQEVSSTARDKAIPSAVIHYLIPDRESEIAELCVGLGNLHANFNAQFGYPVVVFHDGLRMESRQRISDCATGRTRVWFLRVFFPSPPDWVETRLRDTQHPKSTRGYQDAIRFRSQPLFEDELFDLFSLAMTLDADSWFPDVLTVDPFRHMAENKLVAMFPHLGREAASVAVNLHQHTLLFGKLFGFDVRRTAMGKSLIAANYKWYQQIFELDIEVVQISWLRSPQYKQYFQYLDSLGGWWLHRWGNNPVRTFACLLFLDDKDVAFLRIPYAHQAFCTCGDTGKTCQRGSHTSSGLPGTWTCEGRGKVPATNKTAADFAQVLELMRPWQGGDTKDVEEMVFNPGGSHLLTALEK